MLDQFSRELAQLYPRAKILVAERDDTSAAARREFVARCATARLGSRGHHRLDLRAHPGQ